MVLSTVSKYLGDVLKCFQKVCVTKQLGHEFEEAQKKEITVDVKDLFKGIK